MVPMNRHAPDVEFFIVLGQKSCYDEEKESAYKG